MNTKRVDCVEAVNIVLIGEDALTEAESCIVGCEYCCDNATLTFDYFLDALTGEGPTSEFVMIRKAECPFCAQPITEKTLVSAG